MMECKFPHNAPRTAYDKGCRCERCAQYRNKKKNTPEYKKLNAEASARYRAKPENKKRISEYQKKFGKSRCAKHRIKYPLEPRYNNILRRCSKENCGDYHNYGGRGIKCLFSSYKAFETYVSSLESYDFTLAHCKCVNSTSKITIDRINNDGNYEKGNLRWVTLKEQGQNKRKPHTKGK